jgi:tripartite-type tricarboxylate transporter receptor subunit TctC
MKRIVIAAVVLSIGTVFAVAQDWPTKLVKIIVPFAAGATPDLVARLIADDLQTKLNQAFIVEDRPGASGNTGTDAVAKVRSRISPWKRLRSKAARSLSMCPTRRRHKR